MKSVKRIGILHSDDFHVGEEHLDGIENNFEEDEKTFSALAASKDPSLKAWRRLSSMMVNASLKLSVVVSLRKTFRKRLGLELSPRLFTFGLQVILPLRRRL